jgi:hypothetical protein
VWMIEALEDEVLVTQNVNEAFWFISSVFVNFSVASQTRGFVGARSVGAWVPSAESDFETRENPAKSKLQYQIRVR